ncbi:phenylalanyl-tRNA synthetase subunit beta (plasmid) [Mesomycoplasma conjunctivae]|nr:tRNA-binding protein [Mycoplasmopsis fermentans]VEU60054.1 phenylalanyl-tRNA synthetase subunit beta [Mycoplasmopsis fermentans]VEU66937.1 phenylalanyl-tRNA synthetase subunit beta [Mesomycoplasma conjunctivae]
MGIFFNLNSKFKNTKIIYFDTTINKKTMDIYEDMVVFRDENFNVNSVNLLNAKSKKRDEKIFGFLNENETKKLVNKLHKYNKKYLLKSIKYFRIGKIVERKKHPKSDRLFVLKIDFGNEVKQIITNTTYTLENKYFTFCLPGSITANGLEILDGKIMNVESDGMLCSAESLDLEAKSYKEFEEGFFNNVLEEEKQKYLGKEIQELLPELISK